ncbi:myo-inositol-1-monophosphatase [Microdochium trichocladiopsis]|uniref:Inositol-1-monophosphatase n=1 Tax=Microdochium trichocladiopsis TaxID=1682393 RepID=A0A9P9BLT8_9PEZI|nr:myo-inositol-1-monophosphatase [Microdochium trichocladiopsis]KAH7014417.1 myo-inositol-1-monophosphatase [Microdochium trichocladiopsis]
MEMAATLDLHELCANLTKVALKAGGLIRNARTTGLDNRQTSAITCKKNTADIVTETHQASEELIRWYLLEWYPSIKFIGEESFKAGLDRITNAPTFVVDPIDGTSNFVHGLPEVCVSIGLVVSRKPTVGVVHNPFTGELWTAIKGNGAYYSRTHARVQDGKDNTDICHEAQAVKLPRFPAPFSADGLRGACIGIEFGSDRQGPNFDMNLKVFTTLARTQHTGGLFVNSLRCVGSAALAICRVASGQQEAFWECGCWAWDVAAAWCILEEAGGIMVDGHPGGWQPPVDNRRYLAVRPALGEVSGRRTGQKQQEDFVNEFWSTLGELRSTYGPL